MTGTEAADSGLSITEISALVAIAVAIMGGLVWLIKAVAAIKHETQPNSGESMKDYIGQIKGSLEAHRQEQRLEMQRVEQQIAGVRADIQEVHGRVTKHMEWHLDHTEGNARTRRND